MDRHEYFQEKIPGLTAEFAEALAYTMKLRDSCDAAMFPGAYKHTLKFAAETFPKWFLEDRYIREITDPETGQVLAPYVVSFRDWAVSITQETLLDARGVHTADDLAVIADRVISRFRVEREAERNAVRPDEGGDYDPHGTEATPAATGPCGGLDGG